MRPFALALTFALLAALPAAAQTPRCDALAEPQRALAQELFKAVHPYDCCDETLDACLKAEERCRLAERLADDVCRMVKAGKDRSFVERALDKRAQSMIDLGARASFALDDAMSTGAPDAPVQLVVYACARCPFCSVLLPQLYREVTEGSLKGKVRLYFRPYPIKSHPGSTEGALGLITAARLGKFWPFLLELYGNFDQFDCQKMVGWAKAVGMDPEAFDKARQEPALREVLVESKKEGLRNKVAATPTLYVNGRLYSYELDIEVLKDVLAEESEKQK